MGDEEVIISKGRKACSHGGIHSVDPRLVRLDYSSSINPLGTPRKAIAAVKMNINSLAQRYPDPDCIDLKKSLSHYLGIDAEWISVGNGAIEVIYWFVQAAFVKRRVVIPAPTFCEYELASQ
jgi:threonine-phosphate decarboxylase